MPTIILSIWVATFSLFMVALVYSMKGRIRKKKKKKEEIFHPFNVKIYFFLLRFRYTRSLVLRYQYSLKQLTKLREERLYHETGNFFRKLLWIVVLIFACVLAYTQNPIYLFMYVLVVLALLESLIDYVLVRQHNQLLEGQILFNELVRQKYYEQGTVEEALYEACREFPEKEHAMLIQGEYLYDILMESNPEEAVHRYNQAAPNQYLKMLLNLCFITAEYGDSQEKGQSVFMNSLSYLTNEIRVEQMKRQQLNYSLKSINLIAVLPLFFMLPLQEWASKNFQPLQFFYAGRWGKMAEIAMCLIIILAVMLLRKIQNIGVSFESGKRDINSQGRIHKRNKLRRIAFILGIGILLMIHWQERSRIINTSAMENILQKVEDDNVNRNMVESEQEWITAIRGMSDEEQARLYLTEKIKYQPELAFLQGKAIDLYAAKIYEKAILLQEPWLTWQQVFFVFALAFLVGYWHYLEEFLTGKVREMEREDEVASFRSILLMLMHHNRLGMEDVLSWLSLFANYYAENFERCLNNYSLGTEEAFAELKKAKQPDFQTLVLQLETASKDLSLQQAFDDLIHEKAYYLEKRKEINRQMIAKRLALGEIVGFIPAYALIVLYLIIPMIYSGMESLNQFYRMM